MTVFKEIFSGDLFKKGMVINNTPFLVYVEVFVVGGGGGAQVFFTVTLKAFVTIQVTV